jgi:hypothetical protein
LLFFGELLLTGLHSFRRIVCNRHEHRRHYDIVDFVPTQAEADALEELDVIIARRDNDDEKERHKFFLISALRVVPQVNSIEIESRSPFRNLILRKVWEEYALEAYRPHASRENQLLKVLCAAKTAGLNLDHFSHDQLLSSCFEDGDLGSGLTLHEDLSSLKSLELVISDHQGVFSTGGRAAIQLRELISAIPALENLSVNFEILGPIPPDFLPANPIGTLRSLTLSSIAVDPINFLALLEHHASTLKKLRLTSANIAQGLGSWQGFLDELRKLFGNQLEKFQICGMVRSVDGNGEQWLLWPRYDKDWNVLENERSPRTRELEDYVVRGGPWPMIATDSFPFP